MSGQISLFLKNDEVIVIPQGGGGGYSFDIEPILVVAANANAVDGAVAKAFALSSGSQEVQQQSPTKPSRSPVLKKLGAKSFREFYRGASHCFIYDDDSGFLTLLKFRPAHDGGGFELTSEPPKILEKQSQVGAAILECLLQSPQMPLAST